MKTLIVSEFEIYDIHTQEFRIMETKNVIKILETPYQFFVIITNYNGQDVFDFYLSKEVVYQKRLL